MADFTLHAPGSLAEAAALLARYEGEARPIAGGTALVLMIRQGLIAPPALVRLDHVPDLAAIAVDDGWLRLGPLATLRAVSESPLVQQHLPVLAGACALVGNVRVRNAATIGGNLSEADYASDPPCVLVAMRARARAVGPRGEREIPLTEFFTGFYENALAPDEVLTELIVPDPSPTTRSAYIKHVTRSSEDRPCVGMAAVVELHPDGTCRDLRVVAGAVAERPQEIESAEAMARGQTLTDELLAEIGQAYAAAIDPLADVRGSEWYRQQLIRVLVRRTVQKALAGGNGRA